MKKIFVIGALISTTMLLASCGSGSEENTDVPDNTNTVAPLSDEQVSEILADKDFDITKTDIQDLSNHLYTVGGTENLQEYIATLTGSDDQSRLKKSYLESAIGDYRDALAERAAMCAYSAVYCPSDAISVSVPNFVDMSGSKLDNVRITVNTEKVDTAQPKIYNNMVNRIRAEKEGYVDAYGMLNAVDGGYNVLAVAGTLKKAEAHVSTVANVSTTKSVENFEYRVPANAFTDSTGKNVTGAVDLYFFSLDRSDQDLSVFGLTALDANGNRVGDAMITYGMPLVTAYQNGQELTIKTPIEGVGKILGITETMDLQNVPKNVYLGAEELQKYGIPPFWSLDRASGIWHESEMMILDDAGNYRFQITR